MIDRREIIEAAKVLSLRPQVVDKDYVLGWILAGIYAHPTLARSFVFKGGTCLKKCYFETYRFSEDLDFTITDPGLIDESTLSEAFTEICDWVYRKAGIEVFPDRLRFDIYTNPRGEISCQGRFYYRGPVSPRGDPPRIKLDLSSDEMLVLKPVIRKIAHPYSDGTDKEFRIQCYAFEEIFGEKIRALGERCRPRDLYDVIHLFRRREGTLDLAQAVLDVLKAKCRFKGIPLPTLSDLTAQRPELDADWEQMLAHQLQALPPVDDFWNTLSEFFSWLTGPPVAGRPQMAMSAAGAIVSRRELGGGSSGYVPGAPAMETVYFAAANRLCVDLEYKSRVRRLEPYSLRRTKDGNLLFYGAKADTGEIRCFRVDRIQSAAATNQSFTPRYLIELTGSGQVSIPPTQSGRQPSPRLGHSRRPSRQSSGVQFVHECPVCGRQFTRKTRSNVLRKHNDKQGYPCPGRKTMLVDTKY